MKKYLKYLSFLAIILVFKIGNANAQVVQTNYNDVTTYPYDTTKSYDYIINGNTFNYITTGQYQATITIGGNIQIISTTDQSYFAWIIYENVTTGNIEFYGTGPFSGTTGEKRYIENADYSGNGCQLDINNNYIGKGTCSEFQMPETGSYMYRYIYNGNTWTGGQTNDWFSTITSNNNIRIYGSNVDIGVYQNRWPSPAPQDLEYYSFQNSREKYYLKWTINFSRQLSSLDIYLPYETWNSKFEIDITSEEYNNDFIPSAYRFYGKKCNGDTCYWEQTTTNVSISNDSYESINNGIKIKFELQASNNNYEEIKLAIVTLAKNCNITISDTTTDIYYYDINVVGDNYSLNHFTPYGNIIGILINSKNNNNINYRTYSKRNKEWDNITFYQYIKDINTIKDSISSDVYKVDNFYIETTTQNLGSNSLYELYILLTSMGTNQTPIQEDYYIYTSTDVYYTKSNNMTFNIQYENIDETITINNQNSFISSELNNVTSVNFDYMQQLVNEYRQYKEDWIELFESIYNPLPEVIKNMLVIIYFMALCYGIFLIFKD